MLRQSMVALLLIALVWNSPFLANSLHQPCMGVTRRHLISTGATASSVALVFGGQRSRFALAVDWTTFNDPVHNFSIKIPPSWVMSEQELADRRKLRLWTDPENTATALFIAYTPVRDDFTSLQSFGSVDQVAAQTILPKSQIMDESSDISAKMIRTESRNQAYLFDYTQQVGSLQPNTHFRTIFALQKGATGGAGSVLVTITAQTPETNYSPAVQSQFDAIIDSYAKSF